MVVYNFNTAGSWGKMLHKNLYWFYNFYKYETISKSNESKWEKISYAYELQIIYVDTWRGGA